MASLKKNVLSLIVLQGSNYVIPILTLPYLSRVLGVDGFGIYGLVFAIAQYFVLFTDFGFNLTASKKIAQNQSDYMYVSTIFWETMWAKLSLCVISVLLIFLWHLFSPFNVVGDNLIYTSLMIIGTAIMPIWYFQGLEELSKVTALTVFSRLITLPMFFFYVKSNADLSNAIIIQSSINIISGCVGLFIIHREGFIKYVHVKISIIYRAIIESAGVFLATITISLYTISTSIIINATSSIDQVSLFTAGDRIKSAILGVFLIMGNAFYPRINRLLSETPLYAYRLVRKILIYQSVACLFIGGVLFCFSSPISIIMYGGGFHGVSTILMIFSPLPFFVMTSTVLANYMLLPLGYNREYVLLPLLSATVHIPLCLLLSFHYGAVGGALSILVVEVLTMLAIIYVARKRAVLQRIFNC